MKSFRSFAIQMQTLKEQKERIQKQAHELFMQYGLKSVSMDDISSKMGISKKTLYQFFSDKETLVVAVVSEIIRSNRENCDFSRDKSKDAVHEILLAMEIMSELFHHMNPSIIFDLQKYYPQGFEIFKYYKHSYLHEIIKKNIQRGINEGLYREDINIDIMTRFRLESIVMPFNPEFHQQVKLPLATIAIELSKQYLFGIVSQNGYKLIIKYFQSKLK